ncbi:MAG: hypothetical protein P4L59_06660 [Desulfosporosinus sp.]|nr:hypothetical protein [Desulfosporosinus sp.]
MMKNLKTLVTSGLVIGVCLFSALPAIADTSGSTSNPNATALASIKSLRQTDKGLAGQLKSLRQSNQAQRKADRAQKKTAPLLVAKNDQISFEADYSTALNDRLTLEKDTIQLQIDRQAKNETNIVADLNNVINDLNNQISARTQLITDAQKIQVDLGGSASST